ncbi:semaphorin-4G isoform X1 [Xiphias gladius]|uniref:semaphorin-4G isoform X1 n=1 Tax=Xiphias gladius TaxID=8245 RepID=UPI001A995C0B|nr:semaphorin-4G isoform X1 [Xiphias gladius]XP_039995563.1 semaphorin-4G isoform X1 [Xiphias gladius]XP_039995565.1 semaphorin-4G isoform X1 [Xiphias gladius]XP_039995566.1 semaphorin-4G isoform X1 [Xiphias gladius]
MRRSADMQGARSPALQFLLLSCCVCAAASYPFKTPLDLDVTPRVTVLSSGLQGCRRFQSSAVNYSTILLEADSERLYVGARGAVFALNASDISAISAPTIEWEASPEQKRQCLLKGKDNKTECFNHIRFLQRFNSTHLYMCGTHAFRPLCAYIDEKRFVISSQPEEGRDKCPYGPTTGYTALIIDQQMYTASQYEFRSFPDIRRNSPSPTLKTEDAPTRWLNEADFVGSTLVRESLGSSTGDDDKIYFFFTERSQEQTTTYSHSRVARVARVCKGDRGGRLTLQKRWTSFLKARLMCSLPEYDFHFNMLRSVFVMPGHTPQDTLFYGIFGLEWKNVKASAVCRFSLSEVQEAFQGPYMENQDSGSKWKEYTGRIPDPRPGTCITDVLRARGINVSTSLPDDVLDFVRRHPLMSQQVQPSDRRPLLFRRTTDYTHMAIHTIQGLDGQTYRVLYMGTDEGWLHKAVEVEGQLHIIEELQLFEEPQPVNNLLISAKQMSVYVGSPSAVVQLPLSDCRRYTFCYDCIFARDPHCAWNGAQCVDIMAQTDRSTLIQDIQHGSRGCENTQDDVVQRSRSVRVGDDVLLQCELSSNLATPLWTLDGSELQGYGLNSGFRTGTDGLLIIEARQDQSGLYTCNAVENNIKVAIVRYNVTIRLDLPLPPPVDPTEDPYRFFATLRAPTERSSSERPLPPPPAPLLPHSELLSPRNMEAMYLSLITILGGLCVVLTVVLIYVGFCLRVGHRGKYSLRAAAAAYPNSKRQNRKGKQHRSSSHMELKTISSHCNGNGICNGVSKQHNSDIQDGGFLQIVPGEGHPSPNNEPPPPAPPLPPTPQLPSPESDFPNGLSATLPSVLRRMNGNSYVLLRQSDSESTSPLCYSFAEELNRILEKRKHTQLLPRPDESSV